MLGAWFDAKDTPGGDADVTPSPRKGIGGNVAIFRGNGHDEGDGDGDVAAIATGLGCASGGGDQATTAE